MNNFYNEILTDHNLHPIHKEPIENPNYELEGVNPSCGDDIILQLRVNDEGIIEDAGYTGDGCAISQASADIMCDMIIGKTVHEAEHLSEIFLRMIRGKITPEEKEELEEAGALEDISHMPARVKCAVLGWHTMDEMFKDRDDK
ncbi:MAG: SUF system NifU family Fe-S cluster assembly protein [Bacillota bacterium]|nr:SUF system NifU family Fe-S cluster assembly protein [Bacillota bacterium]